jgi:hypothetical protein
LNFAQRYSDPSAFIESKATRYEQLMALKSLTRAELAEWAAIRAEVQDFKLHVGIDIFRSTLDGFKHVNDRNKRLQGVKNLHDATLSPILELDKLMSAISKAGNDKNGQQAEKRKVIEDFVRDLGGDVSKKSIDAIIDSEGAQFNDFYRVIGELRSGVNRVRAEAALTAALAHVGIEDAKARKFIRMVSLPVDHTRIADGARSLGISLPEYINLIDTAYGDRPDLAGVFGRNRYSKAERRKAQEKLEKMLQTKTEQNNQYTENILGAVSSFFVL